jgi:hypothetical protein
MPFVNSALASREPFRRAVASLRSEGVTILDIEPQPPRSRDEGAASFPWTLAVEWAARVAC